MEQQDLHIPDDFKSDADGAHFTSCKVCGEAFNEQTPYVIEKAYKRLPEEDVTIFELAICLPCAEKQAAKMSKESRATVERLMGNQAFFQKRHEMWGADWRSSWKNKCIFNDTQTRENEEYHIVGHFQNGQLMPYQTPFMMGHDMIETIQEQLSAETKEELDNFGQQFLGPDPRIKLLLEDYQFVMV
jgi:hypothetical protein